MEIKTHHFTGRPMMAVACSYCEKENGEGEILNNFLKKHNHGKEVEVSHSICGIHYNTFMEGRKLF